MPISKSAKKSLKVSRTKKAQNLTWEKRLEIGLKKVNKNNVSEVISIIDKVAKNNLISDNKAARLKSRLTKKFETPKVEKKATPKAKAVKAEAPKKTETTEKPKTVAKKASTVKKSSK